MCAARIEIMKTESSERSSRALRHKTHLEHLQNDECVFYKRDGCNIWKRLGTGVGKDGEQVLVKHGGVYVRVHMWRLRPEYPDSTKKEESC